jgi:lipopolysaccharide export system ATP-binding protein
LMAEVGITYFFICERAYIVGEGHVIAEGNTETILANQKVRDTYLGHQFVI